MEFLMNVAELWNELLICGLINFVLIFLFITIAKISAKKKYKTTATLFALIAFFCGDVFRVTTIISLILFFLKLVLNFI